MISFWSIVKISSQGRSSNRLDSNVPQIPIIAVPAPSPRHVGEAGKAEKSGTLSLAAENGLASNCGDDKDAIASICGDLRRRVSSLQAIRLPAIWLLSIRSA